MGRVELSGRSIERVSVLTHGHAFDSTVSSRSSADERELTVQPWRPAIVGLFHIEDVMFTASESLAVNNRARLSSFPDDLILMRQIKKSA